MLVTKTHFRKPVGKLWTFMSDSSGIKTQVDFILIRNKWINSVKNCEAYSNFSSCDVDHRIITATLRLSLRANTKQNKRVNYDWATLKYMKYINRIHDQLITKVA